MMRYDQDKWHHRYAIILLCALLIVTFIMSLRLGAYEMEWSTFMSTFFQRQDSSPFAHNILFELRLPRALAAIGIGAILAIAGTLMQGLLRNPLADSGLLGLSSGAAFGAVSWSVVGHIFFANSSLVMSPFALPLAAFLGCLSVTGIIYYCAVYTKGALGTLLLIGIALNAICGALIGLLLAFADDTALRDVTFWSLGSLTSINWQYLYAAIPGFLILILMVPWLSKRLDLLSLGDKLAFSLGMSTQKTTLFVILLVSISVGSATALAGPIGFIGLVTAHLLRLLGIKQYKKLLPLSGLLGALFLLFSDLLARTLVAPIELPIGVLTSLLGAPCLFFLLLKYQSRQGPL
jgi:iron complex transport system permease protein